jgi:hypothetical protein
MVLADRLVVTPQTNYNCRKLDIVEDRSHVPHRIQTTLTPAQEAVAEALCKALSILLCNPIVVVCAFLSPNVSRSGLDCRLRLNGVGNLM